MVSSDARREAQNDPVFGRNHSIDELEDLLPIADSVVLSLPLTAETTGIMNESRFSQMKRKASLINIGRGGLVDEPALIKALETGQVGYISSGAWTRYSCHRTCLRTSMAVMIA
ncbi:NAD(P)-dependent oxidoreductase [Mesorhizobium sp.]|uniref:NAD(P)-dependent oxidoreductase n=1 Tax=Mesorhizobium sp. TaxID=1871066 RepID=UPI000FE9DDBD|nr:NAD(P)-dependent oxidoreductase [Mesorhizobium sp.]RWP96683.1 MAG: hypothetical protein EOR89_23335 [Mesorhizobium sp.]